MEPDPDTQGAIAPVALPRHPPAATPPRPTNAGYLELLEVLRLRINGVATWMLPPYIYFNLDVYRHHPQELLRTCATDGGAAYFINVVHAKNPTDPRKTRTVPGGTWKSERSPVPIFAAGTRQPFSFTVKTAEGQEERPGFIMQEFLLPAGAGRLAGGDEMALSKIYASPHGRKAAPKAGAKATKKTRSSYPAQAAAAAAASPPIWHGPYYHAQAAAAAASPPIWHGPSSATPPLRHGASSSSSAPKKTRASSRQAASSATPPLRHGASSSATPPLRHGASSSSSSAPKKTMASSRQAASSATPPLRHGASSSSSAPKKTMASSRQATSSAPPPPVCQVAAGSSSSQPTRRFILEVDVSPPWEGRDFSCLKVHRAEEMVGDKRKAVDCETMFLFDSRKRH